MVVTVSREYGTGGRLFAKNLASELGFKYVDKMIAHELAGKMDMSEEYIEHFLDTGIPVGMSSSTEGGFEFSAKETQRNVNLQIESHKLLRKLASDGNIVIVGRASDIILQEFEPFKIFVYADLPSKIARIKKRKEVSDLSEKTIQKEINMVDTERYQHHALFSHTRWGEKSAYDLCINATEIDIQAVVPAVASYIKIVKGL